MSLTKSEIDELKQKLIEKKKEISHQLEGIKSEVVSPDESTGYGTHFADEATDDMVRNVDITLTHVETALIREIDEALARIQKGTYGICEDSKEEIPLKRLQALPWAKRTAKAQEIVDKRVRGLAS